MLPFQHFRVFIAGKVTALVAAVGEDDVFALVYFFQRVALAGGGVERLLKEILPHIGRAVDGMVLVIQGLDGVHDQHVRLLAADAL